MDNQPQRPTRVSVNFSPIVITILLLAVGLYFLYDIVKPGGNARSSKWEYATIAMEAITDDRPLTITDTAPNELNAYGLPKSIEDSTDGWNELLNIMGQHGWEFCQKQYDERRHRGEKFSVVSATFFSHFKRPVQ